jgi:hypothetical protein
MSLESVDAIKLNLRKGYVSQAGILIRWYLELSHLFYYLYMNPEKLIEWFGGRKIRPGEIGKYFEKEQLQSWRDAYELLSNIVHLNQKFVSGHYRFFHETPKDQIQIMLVGKLLIYAANLSCKINAVLTKIIRPYLDSDYSEIEEMYKTHEKKIIELWEQRNIIENKIMAEYDNK